MHNVLVDILTSVGSFVQRKIGVFCSMELLLRVLPPNFHCYTALAGTYNRTLAFIKEMIKCQGSTFTFSYRVPDGFLMHTSLWSACNYLAAHLSRAELFAFYINILGIIHYF